MQYPILPLSSKAINIASTKGYCSLYDIVWSFDYAISGNQNTEAGFTVFLKLSSGILSGGSVGIDLGYSGYSGIPSASAYGVKPGLIGAQVAIGFDTTGLFAASATIDSTTTRDGIYEGSVKKNSVTIRDIGEVKNYAYETYTYHQALSDLNTTFSIVESAVTYKTVRARLGNLGRTLYVDYRNNPKEQFQNILSKNISLYLLPGASYDYYQVGVSFATPISSNKTNAIGNIFLKNFHVEGTDSPNLCATVVSL